MEATTSTYFGHEGQSKPHPVDGEWYEFEFPNGYGASVIRGSLSYGGPDGFYELAVTHGGPLCYVSGITEDVIGWLTERGVESNLTAIAALPSKTDCGHR